jgi:hypothetical protein
MMGKDELQPFTFGWGELGVYPGPYSEEELLVHPMQSEVVVLPVSAKPGGVPDAVRHADSKLS